MTDTQSIAMACDFAGSAGGAPPATGERRSESETHGDCQSRAMSRQAKSQ